MKRYEERLLEDMHSRLWNVLLSERPAIYNLPNELLLLIFDYIEGVFTLCTIRGVSRRFEQLVRTTLFKTIYMDTIRPSRMPILTWVLTKNPSLLNACHSLRLRMCGHRLTWDYPRTPTTRTQDDAQSQLITSIPSLKKLAIYIGHIFEAGYPLAASKPRPLARLGFSRTFDALSQCATIRKLELSGECYGVANLFLLDLFKCIGERLEEISIMAGVLYTLVRAIDTTHGLGPSFPALGKLTHLSLHVGFLGTTEFNQLSDMLSTYFPSLKTLVCSCTESRYLPVDDDRLRVPTIPALACILFEQVDTIFRWMVSLPTKRIELKFQAPRQYHIMDALTQFITLKKGVFGQRCVEAIQLTIEASSLQLVEDKEKTLVLESEQLLQLACIQSRIMLITQQV